LQRRGLQMRTSEQRTAEASLRSMAPGYRIAQDPEHWPIVPGRLGQIEYFDGVDLAVYTDRRMIRGKVLLIPGVRRHQPAEDEVRPLSPRHPLPRIGKVTRARRKRSADTARHLLAHAYKSTPAAQDLPGSSDLADATLSAQEAAR